MSEDSCSRDLAAPYEPGVDEHIFFVGEDMIKSPWSSTSVRFTGVTEESPLTRSLICKEPETLCTYESFIDTDLMNATLFFFCVNGVDAASSEM